MSKRTSLEKRVSFDGRSRRMTRSESSTSEKWEDALETLPASTEEAVGRRQIQTEMDDDLDLTPRPLRVVKRHQRGEGEANTWESKTPCRSGGNISPRVRKCQSQCTMTPCQRAPGLMDVTNLDPARRASFSPTCPPQGPPLDRHRGRKGGGDGTNGDGGSLGGIGGGGGGGGGMSLTVRKVRGGRPAKLQGSSAAETLQSPPADVEPTHPGPAAAVASVPAHAPAHDAMSTHKAETRRAVRGPLAGAGHHGLTPGSAISTASLSSLTGVHGARRSHSRTLYPQDRETRSSVTATERVYHDPAAGRNASAAAPPRQPSLKLRFLNRMMVGLAHKPLPNHPPYEETKMTEAWPLPEETGGDLALHRKSSSVYSDALSDIDQTLSGFPSPPTSTVTSPTTVGSFDGNDFPALAHRNLSVPSRATTVGAELSLMSDYDEYRSNTGVSMSIEIGAVINGLGTKSRTGHEEANALDVAIVIDNSLHNSPDALMSSCETARRIASLLNPDLDRLAIYTTYFGDIDGHKPRPSSVVSLGKIDLRNIKATLDSITNSTAPREATATLRAIDEAQRGLLSPEVAFLSRNSSDDNTFGHLFVLSADMRALEDANLTHDSIQTHVIRQGCLDQKAWDAVSCNGWKVDSFACEDVSTATKKYDTLSRGLNLKLDSLIRHARLGQHASVLKDLRLDVCPGTLYSIDSIQGDTSISRLQAGETRTVVVKLKAAGKKVPLNRVSPITLFNPSTDGESLITELDRMLGHADVTALTANLTYQHPLLPVGTECHLSQHGHLRTKSLNSDIKHLSMEKSTSPAVKGKCRVQKDLALHFANQASARNALRSLQQEFGEEGSRSACPAFVRRLTKELKYQARLADRQALQNSPLKEAITLGSAAVDDSPTLPFEFDFSNTEIAGPQDWIRTSDEVVREMGNAPLGVAEQLGFDNAHRIWTDIRNATKSVNNPSKDIETSPKTEKELPMTKDGKDVALRGKRSFALAPIRNLTAPLRPPKHPGGVPRL